jgi:hypothetical protein
MFVRADFQPGDPAGRAMVAGVVRSLYPVIMRQGIVAAQGHTKPGVGLEPTTYRLQGGTSS